MRLEGPFLCFGCAQVVGEAFVVGFREGERIFCEDCMSEFPASLKIRARPPDERFRRGRLEKFITEEEARLEALQREILG